MHDPRFPGDLRRTLRGHAAFRFAALVLGFGFQIMIVKVLSPESYATYAVLLAILLVGERVLSFGTDRTVLRFVPAFIVRHDRAGMRFLATRLTLVRATGLTIFIVTLTVGSALHVPMTPQTLSTTTTIAFGVWFIAYTLLQEANAIAQSLMIHQWAAFVASCEVLLRLGILALMYVSGRPVDVLTVVALYAFTFSAATGGLGCVIWMSIRHGHWRTSTALVQGADLGGALRHQMPAFARAAYASTLSYLISSPGVIRLVARAGLGTYALAAFSFAQGLATSLSSALPGQLILPSLESVAAKMADSGGRDRVFPALSVLFKIELTFVLSIIIASTIAGPQLIKLLSRPAYAPYYYILPVLMVGLCCKTVYRLIELLGSMHLKYKIFLTTWPLTVAAMVALYLTIPRWGLVGVLSVPLVEISVRVGILMFAFRRHGIWKALDPTRSLRLVLSAVIALLGSFYLLRTANATLDGVRLPAAAGAVSIFLLTLLVIRPLTTPELETIIMVLPRSWAVARYFARRLTPA